MRTISAKIAKNWLLILGVMLLGISLGSAFIVLVTHAPLWRVAIYLAAILIGMTTAGLLFLFTLSLGMIRGKK